MLFSAACFRPPEPWSALPFTALRRPVSQRPTTIRVNAAQEPLPATQPHRTRHDDTGHVGGARLYVVVTAVIALLPSVALGLVGRLL
ncbi:hypothetical protein [Streptomyces chartreusis]|uniref:hypothetical protein n=1 Tax=Streptomyces chartreusis TaxID=1969 RepID=UPI0036D9E18F